METRLTKEALLCHLLDADHSMPDEKTIYSYLLGYRLFQSSDQLLKEINSRLMSRESAEVKQRFQRRSHATNARSAGPVCTKCRLKHDEPKLMSKSTSNMLDKDTASVYVELIRNNVLVKETGKKNIPIKTTEGDLSPALSATEVSGSPVKASDFDDYCEIESMFADNRRNTAPEYALNSAVAPTSLPLKANQGAGTDFGTGKKKITMEEFESLPETNLDTFSSTNSSVTSGEDTIRRRRKGRRRPNASSPDGELANLTITTEKPPATLANKLSTEATITDRRSVASRDSGILSGLIENELEEEFHSNNNNNKKSKVGSTDQANNTQTKKPERISSALHKNVTNALPDQPSPNDSGYSSQISPVSVSDPLEDVSKDIEAHVRSKLNEKDIDDTYARQIHLLHVLLIWVRDFPADFRKNKTRLTLEGLLNSLKKETEELREHCDHVFETLEQSAESQKKYEQSLIDSDNKDAIRLSEDFRTTKENMIAMVTGMSDVSDAKKMAEQLCLIEMDLLSHLGAEEFLQMFNAKGDEQSRTNLGASVRWFNHLSHLVATTVCLCRKPKHRRHVISLFASSADRCYHLSNFNSAMAILTGLSLGAVARLKRTWNKVDTAEIEKLQSAFDPSNNFRKYRTMFNKRWAALRNQQQEDVKVPSTNENRYSTASQHSVTSRLSVASMTSQHRDSGIECENDSGASGKSTMTSSAASTPQKKFTFDDVNSLSGIQDGVLVPFLTLMVKDVYFLNHSTPTIETDGSINFEVCKANIDLSPHQVHPRQYVMKIMLQKLKHLGEILHPLETWKNNPCVYEKNEKLRDFLLHSPVLKDSELYSLSYKREPPKNKFEKSQLKTIRGEIETTKRSHMIRRIISRRKTM